MWRHLPVSVAAPLTVFTKADVIVIAEPKARKLRHNKHVEVRFFAQQNVSSEPHVYENIFSVYIKNHYFGHMGARRNFSRGGQNHRLLKKLARFRRAVQKNDHFVGAPKAQTKIFAFFAPF